MPKPYIDFIVSTDRNQDPKYLTIFDYSSYGQLQSKLAIFEIYLPGAETPKVFNVLKNQINAINSTNLELSCLDCNGDNYVDLPDGIWCINLKASGGEKYQRKKYYLRAEQFRRELDKIYVRIGIEFNPIDEEFIKWANRVEVYLQVAQSFINDGDLGNGQRFYQDAHAMLEKYKSCKNCF